MPIENNPQPGSANWKKPESGNVRQEQIKIIDFPIGSELIIKKINGANSKIQDGKVYSGILTQSIAVGEPVNLSSFHTSPVERVIPGNGKLVVETRSGSRYEIVAINKAGTTKPGIEKSEEREQQGIPNSDIKEVKTARGSVYSYLDDGRTQRYKVATKNNEANEKEPQDILVYIPDYHTLVQGGGKPMADWLAQHGMDNPGAYEQTMLEYAQLHGKTIRIVTPDGKQLTTNYEVARAEESKKGQLGSVLMALIDKTPNGDVARITIPVTGKPHLGFNTFDTRKYIDEKTGETMRQRHIGNAVVEIVKKNSS